MAPNFSNGRCWRSVLLIILFFSVLPAGLAKKARSSDTDLSNIIRPQLLNGQSDPTLRFPIMSIIGSLTYGWLDITNSEVHYTEVQPTRKANRTFEVSRVGLVNLRYNGIVLTFKSPKKQQMIIYLPQDEWGKVHTAFGGLPKVENRESLGTQSIYKTMLNFDGVMALVKPPLAPEPMVVQRQATPPPPKPSAPAAPPAIVLSSPSGASDNQTVEWSEGTVIVRGVAMDSTGIPVVKINGAPVNMRPQTPQAAEFWSDPLPLSSGDNRIQVTAINSAQAQSTLHLIVKYTPRSAVATVTPAPAVNPRALDRLEIVGLLQGGVPSGHIMDLVKERGIKFSPSADDVAAIKAAGGSDDLIAAIQQAAPQQ